MFDELDNQKPGHLIVSLVTKMVPSLTKWALGVFGSLSLGVDQCMSSVLGTENPTLIVDPAS